MSSEITQNTAKQQSALQTNTDTSIAETQAIRNCLQAVRISSQNADAYFALGQAYQQANQLELAIDAYGKTIQLNPGHYKTYSAVANILAQLCRYPEAMQYYGIALKMAPTPLDNVENLFNLGELYKRMRSFEQAVDCYRYVLQIEPKHERALIGLSQIYRQQGKTEESIEIYEQMLVGRPNDPSLLISKALSLPIIYQSAEEIEQWRDRLEKQVTALLQRNFPKGQPLALQGSSFYLGYQAKNDRALAEKIAHIFQNLLPTSPALLLRPPHTKPRIGIVSKYLGRGHTIGKFMQGIIEQLSREQFQITTFSLGREHQFQPLEQSHPDDQSVLLPTHDIEQAAALIREQKPDILLYPDIGMTISSYCLAAMRLAPVQCVTWGHPVTTGLNTIDYFLSSQLIEPEQADEHYSEQLVLLEHLPTYYYRPQTEGIVADRATFGFTETDHLYLCPQSLFKFHPDFDAILRGILEQDSQGKLVLLSHYSEAVNQMLRQRFQNVMPAVADRIHFLPRLGQEPFLQLLACADVMLDPLHFGGGNTTYEALALGLPIVTWPGALMRGRVTSGCYRQMQFEECIVESAEEYIQLAVRLGTVPAERERIRQQILQSNSALYEDAQTIEELERFFLSTLSAQ